MRSQCSLYTAELKTLYFVICSAEDLFTLNSNKFRMVYKVDGNPQLDSYDWSMTQTSFTLNRPGFLQIGMAGGGGGESAPPCVISV